MFGRSISVIGTGVLSLALAMSVFPTTLRAADGPQAGAGNVRPKAEAEPGHGAGQDHGGEAAPHGGEAGGKSNPMEVQPSLALWTLVVFFGLFFVLGRFAWKPLSEALHQREEHLEHCLLQTEKARNESEQLLAEHRRLMAQADERVRALIEKAQKDAHLSAEEIVRQAQAEAESARERAQREIATARDQALAEIWSQTANVAVSVAGKVLSKQLSEDEHRRLIDLAIKELPAAASSNGHGGARA
jgi:F-type H+-transporting ATPase subunit b